MFQDLAAQIASEIASDVSISNARLWAERKVAFRRFARKYGANLAGYGWNSGNFAQLILGAVTLSPREIAAGVFNVLAASNSMLFGHKSYGLPVMSLLSLFGIVLTYFPGLSRGEALTWFSFAVLIGIQVLNVVSDKLSRQYARDSRKSYRETLGKPRRLAAVVTLTLCRVPLIAACLSSGDTKLLICTILWSTGDMCFAFSAPAKATKTA